MIPDANALLVRWISEALSTDRISATVLPEWQPATQDGFRPQDGPWIVISRRGGEPVGEVTPMIRPSVQIRVWADVNQFQEASAVSLEIYEAIHGKTHVDLSPDGWITSCELQGGDQDVVDQETGFATVLSFYDVRCRSGG